MKFKRKISPDTKPLSSFITKKRLKEDEINFMESWLAERNEKVAGKRKSHHMESDMHVHMQMVGMASPQQLKDLARSKSTDL